jgi:hypothetical protein
MIDRLLQRIKPSLPPVALLLEPPGLFAIRVASAGRDMTPLVRHEEQLPTGEGMLLPEPERLRPLVEGVLTRLGGPKRISLILGDPFFRSQVLTIDDFPRREQERQQVILWHLRKTLNAPLDTVRLRYEVLQRTPGAVTLWLTLCQEEPVTALEGAFAAAGCDVGYVGASTIELYNLARAKDVLPGSGSGLLINRTPSSLSFLFTEAGAPEFFRFKDVGAGTESAEDETARVAQELRLTLAYHREKLGRARLDKVVVRRYPSSVILPLEQVLEEETRVEEISDVLPPLPDQKPRGAEWLPLFGLMEGA